MGSVRISTPFQPSKGFLLRGRWTVESSTTSNILDKQNNAITLVYSIVFQPAILDYNRFISEALSRV